MALLSTFEGKTEALADASFRKKIEVARLKIAIAISTEVPTEAAYELIERYLLARAVINRPDQFAGLDLHVVNNISNSIDYTEVGDQVIENSVSATWNQVAKSLNL